MKLKIFLFAAFVLLAVQPAAAKSLKHNIVVQSYRDIQNSNMYEPGYNQGGYQARVEQQEKQTGGPVIAVTEPDENPAEDYNEKIAGKLFEKDMSPVTVELLEPQTKVKVNVGQPLQILLPEDKAKWYYGGNELKSIRIKEDYFYQGQRIINVEALESGKEKVYFDLIDDSGEAIKVLGSRILNITVE